MCLAHLNTPKVSGAPKHRHAPTTLRSELQKAKERERGGEGRGGEGRGGEGRGGERGGEGRGEGRGERRGVKE